ncbi:MAG: hypothetical protein H6970_07105 [Gammaproteobacteria bacterium]|nr:hypothetical protein [Gammaproteobacteria bacterium]MCP5424822.1 hypothetical protein [Gammaproteobacteria bacterium]MCP5458201.1 hypothetical protein [Gammaproteobacteria bacterium]
MRSKLCKTSGIVTLCFAMTAWADPAVVKMTRPASTVYFAKSHTTDDPDLWDVVWSRDYAIAGSTAIYAEQQWDNAKSTFSGKILSIVGPYISYQGESEGYAEGAAHPWNNVYYKTIDMRTGKAVKLTDLFDEREIFQALSNDSVIAAALHDKTPENLAELLQATDGGCDFYIGEESLSHFAFHHLQKNQVAVRLGLSHGCEAARGNLTQIGFYLTVPDNHRKQFEQAQTDDLLMSGLAKLKY